MQTLWNRLQVSNIHLHPHKLDKWETCMKFEIVCLVCSKIKRTVWYKEDDQEIEETGYFQLNELKILEQVFTRINSKTLWRRRVGLTHFLKSLQLEIKSPVF